ncbi:hypothetical protein Tco_0961443 [Tanacetum coccineum]
MNPESLHFTIWNQEIGIKKIDKRKGRNKERETIVETEKSLHFTMASFSALNEEEDDDEEELENVYGELANLIQNTKAGGSSSFTAAAG